MRKRILEEWGFGKVEFFNKLILLLFVFFVNFPGVNNDFKKYSLISLVMFSVVLIIKNKNWKNIHLNKKNVILILLPIYVLLGFLYYPIESNTSMFWWVMERRLFLFFIPLVIFFGGVVDIKLKWLLNVLFLGTVYAIFSVLFLQIETLGLASFSDFFNNYNLTRATHYSHHVPFNLLLNFSATGILFLLVRDKKISVIIKTLYSVLLITISVLLIESEGRVGVVSFLIQLACLSFFYLFRWKKFIAILLTVVIITSGLFVFLNNPRVKRINQSNMSTSEKAGEMPRLFIWSQAISLIMEKPILGHGLGNSQEALNARYAKYNYAEGVEQQHYHAHNQILQTWLEFGIIGLALVLFFLFFPLYYFWKYRRNEIILFWWLLFLLSNMTEPLLKESMGMFPFCIFLFLMYCEKSDYIKPCI